MLRKIITYFLIIAVVLPVLAAAVPLPADGQVWGVSVAHAEDTTEKTGDKGEVIDPCGSMAGIFKGSFWDCAAFTFVNLFYNFVFLTSIWIAGWASDLFNISIQFSLTGESFDADKNIMIKDGWTLVRDLLNLVFIFILLFASISTILQYGGFEIKKVLPSLIVVALLVNFSMMIAKMVIDASHIFAWEFYNQIDVTDGGNVSNLQSSVNVDKYFVKKNLADVFIAGFNPQRLLIGGKTETGTTVKGDAGEEAEKSPWKQVLEKATKSGESFMDTLWRVLIIILFESALAIFAAFILLAGAIMFIIRVVVLWLVIIFSPIAFLGMILPKMGKYSGMWWEYLIGQSFFAPAFLFMFMLATKFINSKLIDSLLKITENDNSKIVTGLNMGEIVLISFNFLIVGGLMMACLIVAKQLGGKTAQFGISWAHKGKDLALGGAKKLAWGPARYGLRYGGGYLADKTLDKEKGWGEKGWAKTLSAIPGVGIGLRKLGTMKKADEDKARKAAEKYAGTLSKAGRTSLEGDIEGTKGVAGFAKRFIYTGPEGAFKPGKEGYEKIIEKKNAEKDERKRTVDKYIELMGSQIADIAGIGVGESEDVIRKKIEDYKKKTEGVLIRGNTEDLDRLTEEEDRLEEKNNKIKKAAIIEKKRKLKLEINGAEYDLNEARKSGSGIKAAESYLLGLTKDLDDHENYFAEIVVKEKHRENLQKNVDKYVDKQRAKAGKPEEKKEKETKSK